VIGCVSVVGGSIAWETWQDANLLEYKEDLSKPHLVILGTGWGAVGVLKALQEDKYNVTVVSPRNYFLFTPLLPESTIGTLEVRSLITPIRTLCGRIGARFVNAKAESLNLVRKTVHCYDDKGRTYELPYDKLVVAIGATNNTFDTEGVDENTHFLKNVEDSINIRRRIMSCFEQASFPGISEEEKKQLLSFVVVGGGPTGVEFAGELKEFMEKDLRKIFPSLVKDYAKISLLQSGDHILNTFDKSISEYTEGKFKKRGIDVLLNCRVKKVFEKKLEYHDRGDKQDKSIPFGLCIWSTGIAPNEFLARLMQDIKGQTHKKSLVTDSRLQVLGQEGTIFSLGDCASITIKQTLEKVEELFVQADKDKSGSIDKKELEALFHDIGKQYPQTAFHLTKVKALFDKFDSNHDGQLSVEEFKKLLEEVDRGIKTLPATAQVAAQQGAYLGNLLNQLAAQNGSKWGASDVEKLGGFEYRHLGMMASIGGDDAVIDVTKGINATGWATFWLWKSVYLSKQVSTKTRVLLAWDWTKEALFGRDISKF
jgi:NADH dehydrogenase